MESILIAKTASKADEDQPYDLDAELRASGLTPFGLAVQCGVSTATVWKWRTGRLPVPTYTRSILRLFKSNIAMLDRLA